MTFDRRMHPHPNPLPSRAVRDKDIAERQSRRAGEGGTHRSSDGRVRAKVALLLLVLAASGLAACGRKDLPDYPPDATERPGTIDRNNRNTIRYY